MSCRPLTVAVVACAIACTSSGRAAPLPSGPAPRARTATTAATPRATPAGTPVASAPETPAIPGGPRAGPRPRPVRSPIGTNLTMLKPWSGEWVFKNAFHQAMPWRSESSLGVPDPRPLAHDTSGWITRLEPGQRAVARFFNSEDPLVFPSGTYAVSWDGRGRIEFDRARVVGLRPNGAYLQVDGNAGVFGLSIVETDPNNPVRNIQVLMPGGSCENDAHQWCTDAGACGGAACVPFATTVNEQPFHPMFLRSMEPYSTLRFMMWNETVGTRVRTWSERVPPTAGLYAAYGAPYEVMVQLTNHLRTDMWINIPLHADDDFVARLAELLKTTVDPEVKIYVEYSNEVWNGGFPMAAELRAQAVAANLSANPIEAQFRLYGRRCRQIFDIFSKVFAGQESRLVRVLAAQNDGLGVARWALEFEKTYERVDALAIAPYFGAGAGTPAALPRLQGIGADQLLDAAETLFLPEAIKGIQAHAKLAAELGARRGRPIALVAYEGGQHFAGVGVVQHDPRVRGLFREANRHPRMKKIYLDYLAAWRANGGHLFMHFVHTNLPSRWGSFGLIERPGQARAESPKLDAVLHFIEKNPRWW